MIRVLVADDETGMVETFRQRLAAEEIEVIAAFRAREALSILSRGDMDVVVLDIRLPDMDGLDLLTKIKETWPSLEVIILTGSASIATAIQSMKLGASDYLTKPCSVSDLSKAISKAYEKKMDTLKTADQGNEARGKRVHDYFVGASDEMMKVKNILSLVAPSRAPVLILGETGTGKELAALAIHELGPRSGRPFVTINSSALQETMLESELFGYRKGAFTGADSDKPGLLEIADHGTFFVDEVGEMGLTIQAKVLRAMETGTFRKLGATTETKVDVRFIFATNKPLKNEVEQGRFRKDLFFRINTLQVNLPPLRQKKDDIPLLTGYFLGKFVTGGKRKRFSREAINLLTLYGWPGNVRELANTVQRSILMSGEREEIEPEDLTPAILKTVAYPKEAQVPSQGHRTLNLSRMEQGHIQSVLSSVKGNKAKAARLLGISRTALYDKLGAMQAAR